MSSTIHTTISKQNFMGKHDVFVDADSKKKKIDQFVRIYFFKFKLS